MLTELHINNFTLIEQANIHFDSGMTVITGETGAGKSMVLDALHVVLGERADNKSVRPGKTQLEIYARFTLEESSSALQWLHDEHLGDEGECLLRRTLNEKGRSLSYINGKPCTLQQLKYLGSLLLNIHGQHEHHALLKPVIQRQRLDAFAENQAVLGEVKAAFEQWQNCRQQLLALQQAQQEKQAKQALLRYQLAEFEAVNLQADEWDSLHRSQQKLQHVQQLLTTATEVSGALQEAEPQPILSQLSQLQAALQNASRYDDSFKPMVQMFAEALINLQEISQTLQHYRDRIELDPEKLQRTEQRLSQLYDLARKHRVEPTQLYQHQQQLNTDLAGLEHLDQQLQELQQQEQAFYQHYLKLAKKLQQRRAKAIPLLCSKIDAFMAQLGMKGGRFHIELSEAAEPAVHGLDQVQFLVSTNPGQPVQPMRDIVSGGELSRLGLAIQVLTAEQQLTPTLIFDEVDVGIGGGTAEIVGQLLAQLGKSCQVLCITHLPQVAAQGDQHLHVDKQHSKNTTVATITTLTEDERVQEIARMLGGIKITASTLAHAREMLAGKNDE